VSAGGRRRAPRAPAAVLPLLALTAVLLLRFWSTLTTPDTRIDEGAYLQAFEASHRGTSPYTVHGYLYPPAFAILGGEARHWLSAKAVRGAIRATNVAGTAAIAWLSASFLPWPAVWRLAASAAYLVVAPGVALAMRTGNVSPVAAALLIAGLLAWPRAPVVAGIMLGASLGWKPLGALAVPVLAAHRPAGGGRRQLVAAAAGAAAALAVTLCGARYLREFLQLGAALEAEDFRVSRTVSLQRLLSSLGLPIDRLAVAVAVAAVALLLARARKWTRSELLCLVIAAACLSFPALWPHTLLLTLPIQVLALRRALARVSDFGADRTPSSGRGRRLRIYELVAVLCGVTALQWSDAVGGLDPRPSLALAAAMTPAVLAPPLLALYAMARPERPHTGC
jgi:hypothetical protein